MLLRLYSEISRQLSIRGKSAWGIIDLGRDLVILLNVNFTQPSTWSFVTPIAGFVRHTAQSSILKSITSEGLFVLPGASSIVSTPTILG